MPEKAVSLLTTNINLYANHIATTTNALLDAAVNNKKLSHYISTDLTVEKYIDDLAKSAADHHNDSTELLFNISLGEGDIAEYAQHKLCEITCNNDDSQYQAAATIRAYAEEIINLNKIGSQFFKEIDLNSKPKLLFIAAANIAGEKGDGDRISALVKDKIKEFDQQETKPQWWVDFAPKDGIFTTKSDASTVESLKEKNHLVKEFVVPDDGACFFRALLSLGQGERWLDSGITPKKQVLDEIINKGWDSKIKDAISNSIDYVVDTLGLLDVWRDKEIRNTVTDGIYAKTIANGEFVLYSPESIGLALGIAESNTLEILADSIGEFLCKNLQAPLDSKDNGAYLIHRNGNHWNLMKPVPPYI